MHVLGQVVFCQLLTCLQQRPRVACGKRTQVIQYDRLVHQAELVRADLSLQI